MISGRFGSNSFIDGVCVFVNFQAGSPSYYNEAEDLYLFRLVNSQGAIWWLVGRENGEDFGYTFVNQVCGGCVMLMWCMCCGLLCFVVFFFFFDFCVLFFVCYFLWCFVVICGDLW